MGSAQIDMITPDHFSILDFWFYIIGINVCPADTKNKTVSSSWKIKQNEAMLVKEYEGLKKDGAYTRGGSCHYWEGMAW